MSPSLLFWDPDGCPDGAPGVQMKIIFQKQETRSYRNPVFLVVVFFSPSRLLLLP